MLHTLVSLLNTLPSACLAADVAPPVCQRQCHLPLALTSFQTQVELRLIQMDASSRSSVGQTAEAIAAVTPATIKLIQDYFEANPSAK